MNLDCGLPRRFAAAFSGMFSTGASAAAFSVIDEILCETEKPALTAGDGAIFRAADKAARDAYKICTECKTIEAINDRLQKLCNSLGVQMPTGADDAAILRRAVDRGWWNRQLCKEYKRRLEHASIVLGLTHQSRDAYISREAAMFQRRQNEKNQKLLENSEVVNAETGQIYTLAELASKGMANKALRRGELMTRIRGFEDVAMQLNHAAMFWTITAPSKFHSAGGNNKKYNGATPRDAQRYLCGVWAKIRAEFNRRGLRPYGFRIAEPHSDGCPHWHMLFFVERKDVLSMEEVIKHYALEEDGDEAGAKENRVKLVNIETGKGGSAAGYIAKYISKNIDGYGVGDHKTFENGETYVIKNDLLGGQEITASQRVTYWSQVWGIRQFQQIGGAPVGVWRELRRVEQEEIQGAPEEIQMAWKACQKNAKIILVDGQPLLDENKEPMKQADFASYLIAQGGMHVGRNYRIRIAAQVKTVEGKYETYEAKKPTGVFLQGEHKTYKSIRFDWVRVGGGSAFDLTWTGVNNCTELKPANEMGFEQVVIPYAIRIDKKTGKEIESGVYRRKKDFERKIFEPVLATGEKPWTMKGEWTIEGESSKEFKEWFEALKKSAEANKNKNFSSDVDEFIQNWRMERGQH